MIEALIKHIQDKGYLVDVYPSSLIIRKYAKGELVSKGWAIAKEDLNVIPWEVLRDAADREMDLIEQAIKEHHDA